MITAKLKLGASASFCPGECVANLKGKGPTRLEDEHAVFLLCYPSFGELVVEDNIIQGKVEPEKTVAVTIVSPSNEVTNKIVKSDSDGSFETKLNPEEKGEHEIFITQDSHTLRTTYTVEDEFKNLELRLDILKALRDILEIIFGK